MKKNRDDIKNIMEKAVELIHQFTNDPYVQRIKERDKTTSMMEIVGVHRKEDRHSDFFKWLFDSFPPSHSMAPKRNGIVLN
jgi:hypothetical protein